LSHGANFSYQWDLKHPADAEQKRQQHSGPKIVVYIVELVTPDGGRP